MKNSPCKHFTTRPMHYTLEQNRNTGSWWESWGMKSTRSKMANLRYMAGELRTINKLPRLSKILILKAVWINILKWKNCWKTFQVEFIYYCFFGGIFWDITVVGDKKRLHRKSAFEMQIRLPCFYVNQHCLCSGGMGPKAGMDGLTAFTPA